MTYRTYLAALVLLAGGLGCTVDKGTTSGTSTSETSTSETSTSTGDETSSSSGPTSTTTGPSDPTTTTDTSTTIPGTTSSTSSAPSEPPDGLGWLQIASPDEGDILLGSTEPIHVVLHDLTAGELIEIRVWSEEGFIDEPTCAALDCTFVLSLEGVVWGRIFLIGASADVMTDEGVVTIDATPVEVEHISP